ncbi:FG-GAP-like repeat-containing protein [Agrilutibacter solisilvae]|uniref:FG-GAP repeat protein n=1 Tax=Agrilutibacter solisilvae TaxID=2763317 RepID=A0A975ARM2_9GAMM|nr:FG-GAP-like repeat-containing protein [Lysobacter solisilvae]QSX77378.1 FG-GAP repeat protein [Lysobacter solisilvae]
MQLRPAMHSAIGSLSTRIRRLLTRARSRSGLAMALAVAAVMSAPAQATFHLMKIVEVFPGTAASPSAQYVVLQMYAGGQNFVSGHDLVVFNAAGAQVGAFVFNSSVPNGANQARILIATPQAVSFFGLSADLTMSAAILSGGGKICFAGTVDCVAWGGYGGSSSGVGTPFNATGGGLLSGRAMRRRLDIAGGAGTLDAGDDTDNCANDFISVLPTPRNNAGAAGMVPASTCGNGALEGLEGCDDGNLSNNDTCSSTCTVQTAPTVVRAVADYNGDGRSDLFWRNSQTGANVLWRSGNAATQVALTTVADANWRVVGRGEVSGDGNADVVWRNQSTGANDIWKSASATTRQLTPSVPAVWRVAATADFNGDGRADIIWRNSSTGADEMWRSAVPAGRVVLPAVSLSWRIVGAGDFNGDGKADLFWRNSSTGANAIWLSANSATQQATATVASQAWRVAGVGDFNGDNKADVLWRNTTTGANEVWRSGTSAQRQVLTAVTNLAWSVVDVGDYDGDRRYDLFWRNSANGQNVIWKSANAATQQAATTVADTHWSVVPLPQ